jgi:hypothetical protein
MSRARLLSIVALALAVLGVLFHARAASVNSKASVSVHATISFAQAIKADKKSDVVAGAVSAANGRVVVDNAGKTTLEGRGNLLSPTGQAGVIVIGDATNQTINFVPSNYVGGGGVVSLHAHCQLQGSTNTACDSAPIYGKKTNTLLIGMDMTVADHISSGDQTPPSFDMAVVYQ